MAPSPVWEQFQHAIVTLARSGPIKDRLTDAYRKYLCRIHEKDLPVDLQSDFRAFHSAVTRERPLLRGEDAFRATVRKISSEEAENLACAVVLMFSALPRSDVRRIKSPARIVPLFSAEG